MTEYGHLTAQGQRNLGMEGGIKASDLNSTETLVGVSLVSNVRLGLAAAAATAMEAPAVKATTYAISVNANKGVFDMSALTKPAIKAVIETWIITSEKGKTERAVKGTRTPETVVVSVGIPKPSIPAWIVTGWILRD